MSAVRKALGGASKLERILDIWNAGKLFYTLSTWGLALAGYVSLFLYVHTCLSCPFQATTKIGPLHNKNYRWVLQ